MIEISTTKQIIDTETHLDRLHPEDEHLTLIYHNPGKKWVCLVDLKKQITALAFENPAALGDTACAYNVALDHVLSLCKSPEQNVSNLCGKDVNAKDSGNGDVTVFGEHNTGEDGKSTSDDSECDKSCNTSSPYRSSRRAVVQYHSKKSSPVQNHQWFCGGKEPCVCMESFKESQKKCTCPKPEYDINLFVDMVHHCRRCGGAL